MRLAELDSKQPFNYINHATLYHKNKHSVHSEAEDEEKDYLIEKTTNLTDFSKVPPSIGKSGFELALKGNASQLAQQVANISASDWDRLTGSHFPVPYEGQGSKRAYRIAWYA
ncbi:hypothetical protein RRG08_026193 [Elysia crispata]|uniref:Uncharacterized protein n=1 Tax=Elysia crispata TaxID=231223 RepID=A0AAE1DDA1_9GAST|nr:hypothetical protein RRG08_026193 [Elysia crispata]